MGRHLDYNHPELVNLCSNCTEESCNGTPCKAYREKEAMLRMELRAEGGPQRRRRNAFEAKLPAIMIEEVKDPENDRELDPNRKSLGRYNAAIEALEALTEDDFFSGSPEIGTANMLAAALRLERRERFEILVDWNRIAGSIGNE